ncbi:hypothetical protein PAMC26510_14460 [Caballeronia sordidicola]|uniref:Uncharacterized protein n=1 Tax=Caballeronia sordidicola TaxID=196367 RepID=A0A242N5T1_CABSO|nr:hypothetical protein PAMC26510_14460 [Caballeronia sordidicola]OTP78784.1 hypothetical protein PAMC26577_04095 [Caballeronia sordidicola]
MHNSIYSKDLRATQNFTLLRIVDIWPYEEGDLADFVFHLRQSRGSLQ